MWKKRKIGRTCTDEGVAGLVSVPSLDLMRVRLSGSLPSKVLLQFFYACVGQLVLVQFPLFLDTVSGGCQSDQRHLPRKIPMTSHTI